MPPAIVAAGIGAVGAIGGGLLASSGASKAAKAQTGADQAAIGEQQREFNLQQQEFAPYLKAGTSALTPLEALTGASGNPAQQAAITALQGSPLYQSLYNNGQEAILQNGAATGGLRGGNMQTSLADFGRDTLSSVIQNQLANLTGLAGLGEGATSATAQLGQNTANNISGIDVGIGKVAGTDAAQQAGIWSGVLNNIAGLASNQSSGVPSFLSKLF